MQKAGKKRGLGMRKKNLTIGLAAMTAIASIGTPMTTLAETQDAYYEEAYDFEDELLPGTADVPEEELYAGEMDADSEELLSGTADVRSTGTEEVANKIENALAYLQKHITNPTVGTINGEWDVLAMARAKQLPEATKKAYMANVYETLNECEGNLDENKYTEYSRLILAWSAIPSINVTVTDLNGYNLLEKIASMDNVTKQGVNGPIYALLALDSRNYPNPQGSGKLATRESLIAYILGQQCADGGWSLLGKDEESEADMTAMAIQALAPYTDRNDVSSAVTKGIARLAGMQDSDGYFASENGKALESVAQVVIALSAVNPDYIDNSDSMFTKNGKNLLDVLLSYQMADGSFKHVSGGNSDAMATSQGTMALVAWDRAVNGQTSFYNMTDLGSYGQEVEASPEDVKAFTEKMESLPTIKDVTLEHKKKVNSLQVELDNMGTFPEKETYKTRLREYSDVLAKQEAEVKRIQERIWKEIDPLNVTLEQKEAIHSIYKEFKQLPEANKELVEGREDLLDAKVIVDKLEQGILSEKIFEKAKESKKDYEYKAPGYTIRVKGKKIVATKDMNANLKIEEGEDFLSFEIEEGDILPAELGLSILCDLEDGVYMLYDSKATPCQWMGVSEGIAKCDVTKGGSYTVKRADIDDVEASESTGDKKPAQKVEKKPAAAGVTKAGKAKETSNTVEAKVENGVVSKEQVKAIEGKDKNLKIAGKMGTDLPYTFILNGKDVKTVKNIPAALKKGSSYEKDIQKLAANEAYVFSFEEKKEFPGKMLVEMTTDLKDGKYLLLRYSEKDRKAEYIQKVTVEEKRTKFLVEKGGDYFLAKKASSKSVDELEAEEKEVEKQAEAMEEEEMLTGTQEEKPANRGILIGVGAVVLAGLLGAGVYLKKRKQGEDHEEEK